MLPCIRKKPPSHLSTTSCRLFLTFVRRCSVQVPPFQLGIKKAHHSVHFFSQLWDLNPLPARYECAALPGELNWHDSSIIQTKIFIVKIKEPSSLKENGSSFSKKFILFFLQIFYTVKCNSSYNY